MIVIIPMFVVSAHAHAHTRTNTCTYTHQHTRTHSLTHSLTHSHTHTYTTHTINVTGLQKQVLYVHPTMQTQ